MATAPLVEGAAAAAGARLGDPLEACAEAARHGVEAKAAQLGEERRVCAGAVVAGATGPADAPAAHTAAASGCGETATGFQRVAGGRGRRPGAGRGGPREGHAGAGAARSARALLVRTAGRFDAQVTVADLTSAGAR